MTARSPTTAASLLLVALALASAAVPSKEGAAAGCPEGGLLWPKEASAAAQGALRGSGGQENAADAPLRDDGAVLMTDSAPEGGAGAHVAVAAAGVNCSEVLLLGGSVSPAERAGEYLVILPARSDSESASGAGNLTSEASEAGGAALSNRSVVAQVHLEEEEEGSEDDSMVILFGLAAAAAVMRFLQSRGWCGGGNNSDYVMLTAPTPASSARPTTAPVRIDETWSGAKNMTLPTRVSSSAKKVDKPSASASSRSLLRNDSLASTWSNTSRNTLPGIGTGIGTKQGKTRTSQSGR